MTRRQRIAHALLLSALAGELVMSGVFAWLGSAAARRTARAYSEQRSLAEALALSDLALWPEASYCRHPIEADLFTPFAEHPGALEHFPAGSFVSPLASPILRSAAGGGP